MSESVLDHAEPEAAASPRERADRPLTIGGTVERVLALQRTAGNQAVVRALARKTFAEDVADTRAGLGKAFAERGQFLLSNEIAKAVTHEFDALGGETWADPSERDQTRKGYTDFTNALFAGDYKAAVKLWEALHKTVAEAKSPQAARIKAFVGSKADIGHGAAADLWTKLFRDQKTGTPDASKFITAAHLLAWRRWEAQACTATANEAARRWVASGKRGGKRSPATAIPSTQLSASKTRSVKHTSANMALGDVLGYTDQLPTQVNKMKSALADGWFVHARVLSGILAEGTETEEHSLLIVGYDGDVFHYFDPDIYGSNEHLLGFDRLFYDRKAKRLSTAYDESEMPAYFNEQTGHYGWHAKGVHRYQVVRIWTV